MPSRGRGYGGLHWITLDRTLPEQDPHRSTSSTWLWDYRLCLWCSLSDDPQPETAECPRVETVGYTGRRLWPRRFYLFSQQVSLHRIHGPRFMDQESGDRVHGHWFHEPCHPPLSRGWVRLLLLCVLHTVDVQRVIECGGIALHSDDSLRLAELPDRRRLLTFRKGSNGLVVGFLLSGVVLL